MYITSYWLDFPGKTIPSRNQLQGVTDNRESRRSHFLSNDTIHSHIGNRKQLTIYTCKLLHAEPFRSSPVLDPFIGSQREVYAEISSYFCLYPWFVLILLVPIDFWDVFLFLLFSQVRENFMSGREHSYLDKKKHLVFTVHNFFFQRNISFKLEKHKKCMNVI